MGFVDNDPALVGKSLINPKVIGLTSELGALVRSETGSFFFYVFFKAALAIAGVLGTGLNEPQVARAVHRYAGATGATIVVSASMPIRDLEWFAVHDAQALNPRSAG